MKKLAIIILVLVLICCLVACNIEKKYFDFYALDAKEVFTVPYLSDGFVPQGLTTLNDYYLVSGYMDDDSQSRLCLIGEKYVTMQKASGEKYYEHAGGVGANGESVWVVSGKTVMKFQAEDLLNAKNGNSIKAVSEAKIACGGATCFVFDGYLWVAEFYEEDDYKINGHSFSKNGVTNHAIACGYEIDNSCEGGIKSIPSKILSIPDKVQGIVIDDKKIVLSTSYGRKKDSHLLSFSNPFDLANDSTFKVNEVDVPVWILDSPKKDLKSPPMAEGIIQKDNRLVILFESGANKYKKDTKKCLYPLNNAMGIIF